MNQLVVKNDIRKLSVITLSFVLIGVCLTALSLTQRSNVVLVVMAVFIDILIVAACLNNIKRMRDRSALFVYTEDDVTDYTKPNDVITLPWSQVLSVQLKAANSNDLMLDVMGYKTVDQLEVVTPEMRKQLSATGGDRVYYMLELSGLWVRRSKIQEAYEWIEKNAKNTHPDIVFTRFKDPLAEKFGSDKGKKAKKSN